MGNKPVNFHCYQVAAILMVAQSHWSSRTNSSLRYCCHLVATSADSDCIHQLIFTGYV